MAHQRQTALITGASAGIGRLLAGHFARDGYDLVLVARRRAALDALAAELSAAHHVRAQVLAIDLSDPEGPARVHESLDADGAAVDVVVNNAGFGLQGHFATLPLDRQLQMIQLNIVALTDLTRRFLPGMLERDRGGILNVASMAAFQPGPFMSVYYATKAYVLSFTEALAEEVSRSSVRVSCLAPGPTETEFAEVAGLKKSPLFNGAVMDAEPVARAGYEGWKRRQVLVIPGASNRLSTIAVRLAPRATVRKITRRLNEVHE